MTGYVRNDVTDQIANGNTVDAVPLDGEFDALQSAFASVGGHAHNGAVGEGAPITVVGPAQDVVVSANSVTPKTDNTIDLGSSSLEWKDLWVDGTANIDSLVVDTADINGGTIDGAVIGGTTPAAVTATDLVATTATIGGAAVTTNTATQTLTNKTINLANNTLVATSAQLAASVSDETGSGALVFAASPALSGVPTAPTAVADTNTTQVATTAHVFAERSNTATLTNKTLTSPTINGATISGGTISGITDLAIADGGTGASDAAGARTNLGITIPASVLNRGPDPENRVINGAFDFWQRGTSGVAGGYVAADRWRNVGNTGTNTQSRQNFNVGDKLGVNCPQHFLRQTTTGTSGVGDFALTTQRIENVRTYAGETITVLGWAKRASGAGNTAVSFVQNFGTGGSPSAEVYGVGQQVALTGVWTPFAVQMSLPSVSSRTFGTNNDSYLEIEFWTSAGSNFNSRSGSLGIQTVGVDLWGIHIRLGTHTADAVDLYRAPEHGPELARCQRYYQNRNHTIRGAQSFAGQAVAQGFPIPPMRAIPSATVSVASPSGAMNGAPTVMNLTAQTVDIQTTSFSSLNANGACSFVLALDAEL